MNRTFVVAIAAVIGVAGYAETAPRAQAAENLTAPRSLDEVRANALAEMRSGNLMTVGKRGWRGGKRAHGRQWRGGGRNWRGGRHYGGRHYGSRRYYGGRRYYHRRHRGHGAAVAAGVAGLAIGAMAADANARAYRGGGARSKQWCANRYRSYDWRSGTFMGYDGVRRRCP